MGKIQKGSILIEGKTKIVHSVVGDSSAVILEAKNAITANDDPSLTRQMEMKAQYATTTTCAVFELLRQVGAPIAYRQQISDTEFMADNCQMILLEAIARRYAVGSYLKRCPGFAVEGDIPHRFAPIVFELFLKTTVGKMTNRDGVFLATMPLDMVSGKGLPVDDPFISNPYDSEWKLLHSKVPYDQEFSDIGILVPQTDILPAGVTVEQIEQLTWAVFLALEGAWDKLDLRLIDFKIEFGVNSDGQLVVADVIDNDSWRLRTKLWEEISKQLHRDGVGLDDVTAKYALVANLVQQFHSF